METLAESDEEETVEEPQEPEAGTERDEPAEEEGEAGSGGNDEAEGGSGKRSRADPAGTAPADSAAAAAVAAAAAQLGVDSKDAASDSGGPARLFRSGKGPAEQAYDLYLKEMAQWKEAQLEEAARQKLQHRGGHRGKTTRLASLDLDSSGSDTDLEDVNEPSRESWAGLAMGLSRLYDRACTTYQVTALTQFKFQLTSKCLTITNMSLRPRDVAAMCIPLGHKDDLTYIDLSGNLIGTKGLASLLGVAKEFRHLAHLDLSNNSLGSEAAQMLAAKVDSIRTLKALNLAGNSFLERDGEHIASIVMQLESLRTLNLSSNTFGSHGGELIGAALRINANMENLNLSGCEIRMQGAVAIGMALKENGSLDTLDLSYNGFADQGAKAIADSLKTNAALTVLNLISNRICHDGAKAIGDMLGVNETLKELYLDKNSITSHGAEEIFAKLKENENSALKILDMKNVSVTYKTAAAVLPTVHHPLLVRMESFIVEPGSLREQLGIPNGAGGSVPLTQKLQAEAAHVLRVFTATQRLNLVRLAREASGKRNVGCNGGVDGLSEAEMRRLLLSLPIGLLDDEVDGLIDSLRGEPDADGNFSFSLNSLLHLGEQQQAKLEILH